MKKTGSPRRLFEKVDLRAILLLLWFGLHEYGPEGLVEFPWRHLKERENPPEVLTVKNRISIEGPEHKCVIYGRLRASVEGFVSTLRNHLGYDNFTWKSLENASIHTSLAFSVAHAVTIAVIKIGKPDKARSAAWFA